MRKHYENEILKLRENCSNNKEVVSSLQDILGLQENEYFNMVVKKNQEAVRSM